MKAQSNLILITDRGAVFFFLLKSCRILQFKHLCPYWQLTPLQTQPSARPTLYL